MSFNIPEDFSKATGKLLVTVVRANPNCTGVILPEIGHGVSLAKPEFFNHLVEVWIKDEDLPKECEMIR